MSVDADEPMPATWKEMAAKWLFSQGVSTVLLVGILFYAAYVAQTVIPWHMQMMQSGYDRNATELKAATAPLANSVDKLADRIDRVVDEIRRERGSGS